MSSIRTKHGDDLLFHILKYIVTSLLITVL